MSRWRVLLLAAVVAVVVLGVGGVVARSALEARRSGGPATTTDPTAAAQPTRPHVVFRQNDLGSRNGVVASVALDDPSGPRRFLGPVCDRVDATREETVCLRTRRGVVTAFEGVLLDARGREVQSWPLPGIPSRTRLSPSGRLEADTTFVTGHSYMQVGFSTATVVRRVGGDSYGNLERFALTVDGKPVTASDRNIWGVTFADDDDTFYATAASGGTTWLVRGDLSSRTLTAVHDNAECPSLSPDGRRVAYKKRVPRDSTHWSLAVLDLASGRETVLGERRSVDDQVEWLDDSTLLYGLPRTGRTGVTDVWAVGTSATARPHRLISDAWSPSVVR